MHPRIGASWEGFIIEKVIAESSPEQVYFWATHNGAELDLLLLTPGRRVGVEVKRVAAPRRTRSMAVAVNDLRLDALYVVPMTIVRYFMAVCCSPKTARIAEQASSQNSPHRTHG